MIQALKVLIMAIGFAALSLTAPATAAELARFESVTLVSDTQANFISVEIADTDELRARGLMFRHRMPEDQGMLFDFGKPRPAAMWMKNTLMSLDMFFIRTDGTIAAIAENTEPKSLDTISVSEPVKAVLEMAGGSAKRLGIKVNDRVVHRIFKNKT
jgi:uncharacterized protein